MVEKKSKGSAGSKAVLLTEEAITLLDKLCGVSALSRNAAASKIIETFTHVAIQHEMQLKQIAKSGLVPLPTSVGEGQQFREEKHVPESTASDFQGDGLDAFNMFTSF